MRAALFVAVVVLAGAVLAADRPAPPQALPGDGQDLVLFLDARPYLIRLHLQVNGRSYQRSWDETVDRLFRYLDVDGDGALDAKEAALAPSTTQWVQLMTGLPVEPDAAPDFAAREGGPTPAKVTRERLLAFYQRSGAGALQVEWGWRPQAPDQLTDALVEQLDANKDGWLSRQELSAAETALHPLDMNGNEIIQAQELSATGAYPVFTFRSTRDAQPAPKNFPFLLLQAETPDAVLSQRLLAQYDANMDGKLSRGEFPLEKAAFDRLDADHDGLLVPAELTGWRKQPPDLELIVPLEKQPRQDILVLAPADAKPERLTAVLPPAKDGTLRFPIAEKQLELGRGGGGPSLRQRLLEQFDAAAGKGGLLAEKAIYQPPFTFVALLRLADRNGDNQLSRKELADYLEMQEKFFFRTTYLTVMDRGRSLFEFLDADHDGRLSPRELRSAWVRLSPWDHTHSGKVALLDVPRQFQLVLSYGQPRANVPAPGGAGYGDMPVFRDRSRGPLWFRKMDRNGDGDVSRREFLGNAEQFKKIDADGDGLIDAAEADRSDRVFRKERP